MASAAEVIIDVADPGDPNYMADFFRQKETIEDTIAFLQESTQTLVEFHANIVGGELTNRDEELEQREATEQIVDQCSKRATQAKTLLNKMKVETLRMTDKAQQRIRKTAYGALARQLVHAIKAHQQAKQKLAQEAKGKVLRLGRTIMPGCSEEEVLDKFSKSSLVEVQQQRTQANRQIKRVYNEMNDRYQEVEKLQRSVAEMYQMFVDLATLVEEQGEVLNSIEANIDDAGTYIEKANKHLVDAHKKSKKARTCMCCLAIIAVAVLLAIVVPSTISAVGA